MDASQLSIRMTIIIIPESGNRFFSSYRGLTVIVLICRSFITVDGYSISYIHKCLDGRIH